MAQVKPIFEEWLIAIKYNDDRVAFSTLYKRFWQDLFMHAFRRVRDEQRAEDLVQELFVELWEQRGKLDTGMNLPAYLYGILKFKIIDFFRSEKIKPALLAEWAEDIEKYAHESPEGLEAYLRIEQLLADELEKMPTNMRQIILMRWDRLNIREIASTLALSEQTVKNNITEGSKRLQRILLNNNIGNYSTLIGVLILALH